MFNTLTGKEFAVICVLASDPEFQDRFVDICKVQADHRLELDRAFDEYEAARRKADEAEERLHDVQDSYEMWYNEHTGDLNRLFGEYVKAHADVVADML